jgi:hypothetical protein
MRELISEEGIDSIKYVNKETNEVLGYVDYEGHLPEDMYYAIEDSIDDMNRIIKKKLTNVRSISSDEQSREVYGDLVAVRQMAVDLLAIAKFYKKEFNNLSNLDSYFSYARIEKAITRNFDNLESVREVILDYLSDHGYDVEKARNIRDYKSPIKLQ